MLFRKLNNQVKKAISLSLAISLMTSNLSFANIANSNIEINELIGTDRYDTAVKISEEFSKLVKIETVVIVNGAAIADGLTATPLASIENAPILLTEKDSLPSSTKEELERLSPNNIIIIGGEDVISKKGLDNIKKILPNTKIERIGGKDRYETSLKIAQAIDTRNDVKKVYIGYGYGEPDALSIAAKAGEDKQPIILSQKECLDKDTYEWLKKETLETAYFIGGEAVLNDSVINEVNEITNKGVKLNRVAGEDRHETNAKVIEKFYTNDKLNAALVTKSNELVDALTAGPLASKLKSPIILASQSELSQNQKNILDEKSTETLYRVGGGINEDVFKDIVLKLTPSQKPSTGDGTSSGVVSKPQPPATNPILPEVPSNTIDINAKRINKVIVLNWTLIDGAKYIIKKGETKEALSIIEDNLIENVYIDQTEDTNKRYYYMVESKAENGEIKKSQIIEVKPFIDTDEDFLEDSEEIKLGTDPKNPDTDGDGLLDGEEVNLYETNPKNPDTDGDGLNDAFEVLESRTSPNQKDTDSNGISDDKEDLDKDSLNNKKELELGTDPLSDDTDYDNLKDNKELELGTDPKNKDTDGDTLLDGDEISVNLNPLKKDTDDDGTLDPNETVDYEFKNSDIDEDEDVQVKINVSTDAKNMEDIYIRNTKGSNFLTNEETPGYLGAPYYLNIPEGYETTVEFTYNGNKEYSGELGIYFYNKETQYLEEITNGISTKKINSISAKVDKPGEYILLDKEEQRKAWEKVIVPPSEENKKLDVVLAIDSSGSMGPHYDNGQQQPGNDADGLRKVESKIFVNRLINKELGRAAIVDFDSIARVRQGLTTDIEKLNSAIDRIDSSGGTNISKALTTSTNELKNNSSEDNEKYTLLLTDGEHTEGSFDYNSIEYAKENNNKVYTIGLGNNVDEELLRKIAEETGGRYLHTDVAEGLESVFEEFTGETIDKSMDTDKDGISDYHEEYFRIGNGRIVTLDKNSAHTDEDGIPDGEEAGLKKVGDKYENNTPYGFNAEKGYWKVKSDPSKFDTDGDDIADNEDIYDEDGNVVEDAKPEDNPAQTPNIIVHGKFAESDKIFMDASDVTYLRTSGYRGKTLEYFKKNTKDDIRQGFKNILDWEILYSDDSAYSSSADKKDDGFGAIAIMNNNKIIIAFEGTAFTPISSLWQDFVITDLGVVGMGYDSSQVYGAYKFVERVLNNDVSKGCKIYITGHSLGGWLAQKVGGSILQGGVNLQDSNSKYYKSNQIPDAYKSKVTDMYINTFRERRNDIKKIVTYAAPGFYKHTEIYKNNSEVNGKVFNYKMKHDPVSTVGRYDLELGNTRWCKLGHPPNPFQHPLAFYYENYSYLF